MEKPIFPNPYNPQRKSREERRIGRAMREYRPSFEADLDPDTHLPRIRFNYANGWTASLVLRYATPNGCDFMGASVAAFPTGKAGQGPTKLGPTEASADEAMNWLDDVRTWEPA